MCQMNGRFANSAQCCLKNSSRNQSERFFFVLPACSSSSLGFAGDHICPKAATKTSCTRSDAGASPATDGRQTIPSESGEGMEIIQLSLFRPPVAKQSTHRNLPMVPSTLRVDPRTTTASHRRTTAPVAPCLLGNRAPVLDVEWHFRQGGGWHFQARIYSTHQSSCILATIKAHKAQAASPVPLGS